MPEEKLSRPIQLLDIIWKGANDTTSHSWSRLNVSMWAALNLAIGSGLKFEEGDFAYINSHYRSGYWIGESYESLYTLAVTVNNISAIENFECFKKRSPVIADNIDPGCYSIYLHTRPTRRKRGRLAVGYTMPWQGEDVIITSFGIEDGETHAIACAHSDGTKHQGKVTRRFKIVRADIITDRKARTIAAELKAAAWAAKLEEKNKPESPLIPVRQTQSTVEVVAA